MKFITPLRYPGGKARLASALADVMDANGLVEPAMAEPFAGGAGASLELLFSEKVRSIAINDLDYRIFAFWWAILNHPDLFLEEIENSKLSIKEWRRQRDIYRNARKHKRFDVGFATFYLNRTNRSGILVNGGPIGGFHQSGEWRLSARFNKSTLKSRIERITVYRDRISLYNLDAMEFVDLLTKKNKKNLFVYLDPPYYEQGAHLYLSKYSHDDHVAIGKIIMRCPDLNWVMTYDDVPQIRAIYKGCRIKKFSLRYTAQRRREGEEVLIAPKSMALPKRIRSNGS